MRAKVGSAIGNAWGVNEGGADGRIQDHSDRQTQTDRLRPTERGRNREGNRGGWVSILFPFFSSPSLLLFSLCLFTRQPGVQFGRRAIQPAAIRTNSPEFQMTSESQAKCTKYSSGQ